MEATSRKNLFIGFAIIFVVTYFLVYVSYSYFIEAKLVLSYDIQAETTTTPVTEKQLTLSSTKPKIEITETLSVKLPSTTTAATILQSAAGGAVFLAKSRPLRVWTMDFHLGTRSEILTVFQRLLGFPAVVVAGSRKDIANAVGNKYEMLKACPHPHVQRRRFFEIYRTRKEILNADLLYHEMKPGNTEFLMPFNKSIIFYLATHLEFGRENPIQVREWYLNLRRLAADPRSVIVANNWYEHRSLQYFVGINSTFIPSVSLYTNAQYDYRNTVEDIVIIGGNHQGWYAHNISNRTNEILVKNGSRKRLLFLRDVLPLYKYTDLVKYRCMVHMPYTYSTMSQFETYNMGIPSLFPSLDYIAKLEDENFANGQPDTWRINWAGQPILKGGPFVEKDCKLPNACANPTLYNITLEERKAWWRLSDFYHWKNAIYYDSPEDLAEKLLTTDFAEVSKKMVEEVKEIRAKAKRDWRELLDRILNPMPSGGYQMPSDYYLAMQERWNVTKSELDESEEVEGAACEMYAESGVIQKPGPEFV